MRERLSVWFDTAGRDLPWRRTTDPYAILVSEFMLQQTTVAAVIPYYERWLKRFPTVADLAAAPERDVLALWQGLGYYSRARNLLRAAQAVMEYHGGRMPVTRDVLRALPGVGDYTAAAVAAFAYDAVEPVIDANIARVLARLRNWTAPIDDAKGKAFLLEAAQNLLPRRGGRKHNSALMELGALVCTARAPRCVICPVQKDCRALDPASLPRKRPRPATEYVEDHRAFIRHDGLVWLEPSAGPRWRGMWLLPPAGKKSTQPALVEVYPITRYKVTMSIYREKTPPPGTEGFPPDELPPMPSPHRRAVAALLQKGHTP